MIPTVTIKATATAFDSIGLDLTETLRAGGASPAMLRDPFSSIPAEIFAHLWIGAVHLRPEATLPTAAGLAVPPNEFDLLEHVGSTGDTMGHSLRLVERYRRLATNTSSMRTTRGTHDWLWVVDKSPPPYRFIAEQWVLASLCARFRQDPHFSIREVYLSQPDRGDADRFARLWGVPVTLGRRYTGVRLADGVMDLPNPTAHPHLRATLTRLADGIELRRLDRNPFASRVRKHLLQALRAGRNAMADIADDLGLSVPAFQRRLRREGVTFSELLDTHRRESALRMLFEGERNIGGIAYDLGYDDQGSFNRAFRRWTGTTPMRWALRVSEHVDTR